MKPSPQVVTDATFQSAVLESSRPVLVDYWAERCAPCKVMSPLVTDAARHYADRLAVVTLKVDENPAVPTRFGVRSFPTFMIFRAGQPVGVRVGTLSRAQLRQFIESSV